MGYTSGEKLTRAFKTVKSILQKMRKDVANSPRRRDADSQSDHTNSESDLEGRILDDDDDGRSLGGSSPRTPLGTEQSPSLFRRQSSSGQARPSTAKGERQDPERSPKLSAADSPT